MAMIWRTDPGSGQIDYICIVEVRRRGIQIESKLTRDDSKSPGSLKFGHFGKP